LTIAFVGLLLALFQIALKEELSCMLILALWMNGRCILN